MAISCMMSSTSSSALSMSITLIATASPVRLSTLVAESSSQRRVGAKEGERRIVGHQGTSRGIMRTLCRPCQNCHHLRMGSQVSMPHGPTTTTTTTTTTTESGQTDLCNIPSSTAAPDPKPRCPRRHPARVLVLDRPWSGALDQAPQGLLR